MLDVAVAIWAPEIHYMKGTWWIPHSLNVAGHGLLKSTSGKPEGPYVALPPISSEKGIDAHLFEEGEKTYYLWGADNLVSLNPDLSSTAGDIQKIRPPGKHPLGYEGIFLNKIDNKYLLIASGRYAYENDDTYDLYYSVGKNLNGPYGPRRMAVKNAGHGNLFQDKSGRWWATAFDHKHVTGKERWSPWIVPIEIKSSPDDLEIIVKDERFRPTEADQIQIKELRSTGIPKGREGLAPWEKPLPTKEESATPPIKNNPLSVDGHPFFGADPSAIVVPDGRLFLFPTTDNRDWEKQFGWSCYSSSDLVDWKNHGVIFSDKESGWGKNRAWAPDITHRDAKFYLYYYFNNGKGAPVKGVGVAVADQPEGPYKELSVDKPLVGGHDPAVFADTDGRYWLYLQDKVFELADDMASFKSGPTDLKLEYRPEKFEAAYVFNRDDLYYFTIARDWNNLIYYTAKSPTGPFKFRGEFFKKYGGNNHHSIVKYKGKWLIFYHEWVRENPTQQRQLRAEYLHFNPDGTIKAVEPTDQGVRFASPLKSPPQKTK